MKRLAAIGGACVLAVAILMAGPSARSGSAGDSVSVDALFNDAAGLVGGEDVKVAGVPAGTVQSVELTDQRQALVRMHVDSPFAPFRADARCEIRSQSLIGERFIQCDPGTPAAGALATPPGSDTPTVPADHNTAPIDLDLLFDTFRAPYSERLAIILNELGAGLTGRGEDLNAIIRDANPALAQARQVLATLNGQKADLKRGIDDTDRALAAVAADPASLDRFIGKLAAVSERFGRHSSAVGESVARLPGLLGEAEPALRQLDGLSIQALPVVRNLRRTGPAATELASDLGPLARSARPTLSRLGQTAVTGRTALVHSLPFAGSLKRTLVGLRPITPTLRDLLSSLVQRGGTEGLVRFFYNSALATSRFDGTSHIFPAHLIGGICGLYRANEPPVEGCHGRFTSATVPAAAKRTGNPGAAPTPGAAPPGGGTVGGAPRLPSLPSLPSVPALPTVPSLPSNPGSGPANPLLDFLLGR